MIFITHTLLSSAGPRTLHDIGSEVGVGRERARHVEARMVKRLRAFMESQLPDFGELMVEEKA